MWESSDMRILQVGQIDRLDVPLPASETFLHYHDPLTGRTEALRYMTYVGIITLTKQAPCKPDDRLLDDHR